MDSRKGCIYRVVTLHMQIVLQLGLHWCGSWCTSYCTVLQLGLHWCGSWCISCCTVKFWPYNVKFWFGITNFWNIVLISIATLLPLRLCKFPSSNQVVNDCLFITLVLLVSSYLCISFLLDSVMFIFFILNFVLHIYPKLHHCN